MDAEQAAVELRAADRRNDFSAIQEIADAFPALGREWAWRRVQGGAVMRSSYGDRPLLSRWQEAWADLPPGLVEILGVEIEPLWDDRIGRLFACDCAEDALPLVRAYHHDAGPLEESIKSARLFAAGTVTVDGLREAHAKALQAAERLEGLWKESGDPSVYARSLCISHAADAAAGCSFPGGLIFKGIFKGIFEVVSSALYSSESVEDGDQAEERYTSWLIEYLLTGRRVIPRA